MARLVWETFDRLAPDFRRARFVEVRQLIESLPRPARILDIGGTMVYWRQQMQYLPPPGIEITLLNLEPEPAAAPFRSVVGDARNLSQFGDRTFDAVFSNSVIEHVESYADRKRMASEITRVAPRYIIQTPNYYFPIEPHFLFPGFQFLSGSVKEALVSRFDLGFYAHASIPKPLARYHARAIRLLTRRDLANLFPGCRIKREKLLGLTKSYTAIGGW